MTKLSFIIGYGALTLPTLLNILAKESREHGFEYVAVRDILSVDRVDFIKSSDAIFLYSHKLPSEVENAIKECKAKIVLSLSDAYSHLLRVDSSTYVKAVQYYKIGGERNLRSLVHLLLRRLGFDVEVEEVVEVPWHGILHPRYGSYSSLDQYMKSYPHANRPLVGVLFYRSHAIYGRLEYVKALIDELEGMNLGVIPVYTYGFRDPILNTPTAEESIREFFFEKGNSVIEALINLTSFFLLDHGKWSEHKSKRFNLTSGVKLLKKLDVPIITPIISFSQSVDEWLKDERGVDYLSQVYRVIMPEVDGLIEPIFLAGSKATAEGTKVYELFNEHVKYIARRVRKWIELRRKNPRDRKVAIILMNPPCKNLEATIGVGFGLDVPESVVRFLHKLRDCGYHVGDYLPRDGDELIKVFLDRKAISEFRWTSVEEIVERGGAVDFVDAETYMKWFNELPEPVRSKMISDWGHPLDVLSGKVSKELVGMVYNGKFVIPGILFGNVFITTQPKFGCAGPACDGRVCKILHDPTITPPHQWLAVYRWITRIFKADVIIHFGTHGYLEFRPGKGVGLSPQCWPEISVDDVPHLYVYVVSNPMEGVIAKRRSYAVIVDHMYPPMMMADVLEELDSLLAQYMHAEGMGDHARAKVVLEDLVKKAKKYSIPVDESSPSKIVESIHRYITAIRSTQVESGLHILGSPPRDLGRLAEYIATAMATDTHEFSSLKRVLAEYLNLNYDELKLKPHEFNRLGLTNLEVMNLLHKLAVNTLKKLLELEVSPSTLNFQLLRKVIDSELQKLLGSEIHG